MGPTAVTARKATNRRLLTEAFFFPNLALGPTRRGSAFSERQSGLVQPVGLLVILGFLTGIICSASGSPREGAVFHTYSTTARGLEFLMGYYPILDRAPKGRNEADSPHWLRRHDEYARRAT